jgi:hypothetical protein
MLARPALPRPPHPAPTFVTMANAPLRDGMAGFVEVIWGGSEAEYFCERDWTGQISLKLWQKIARPRTRLPPFEQVGYIRLAMDAGCLRPLADAPTRIHYQGQLKNGRPKTPVTGPPGKIPVTYPRAIIVIISGGVD